MKRKMRLFLFLFLLAAIAVPGAAHAVSRLDRTFGHDGRVAVELGEESRAHAVAIQEDGRIIVAGSSTEGASLVFSLVRFKEDGTLDETFKGEGKVLTPLGKGDSETLALGLLSDGRIVAAGYVHNGTDRDFALACYQEDGSLDRSFGEGGVVITQVGRSHEEITAIAIDGEDRIIVTGSVEGTAGRALAIGRYSARGELDAAYGDRGLSLTGLGTDATAEGLVLRDDGSAVVSGSYEDKGVSSLVLVGFTPDGVLDEGFGQKGVVIPAAVYEASEGYRMTADGEGRLYVAASIGPTGKRDAALFRFMATGEVDEDFGRQGAVVTAASKEDDLLYDVTIGASGIVASGYTTEAGTRQFMLISYTGDSATVALPSRPATIATSSASAQVAPVQEVQILGDSSVQIRHLQLATSYAEYARRPAKGSSPATQGGKATFRTTTAFPARQHLAPASAGALSPLLERFGAVLFPEAIAADGDAASATTRVVTTSFSEGESVSYAIATDQEGKVVVVGTAEGSQASSIVAARFAAEVITTGEIIYDEPGYTSRSIFTKAPADVTRTTVTTGGEITPAFEQTVTKRGVVFSTVENPVFSGGSGDGDGDDGSDDGGSDDGTAAPVVTITSPKANEVLTTTTVPLNATTDVAATCRYDDSDSSYDSMTPFATTGAQNHSVNLPLAAGGNYTYYVRCRTASGVANTTSASVTFRVASNATSSFPRRQLDQLGSFLVSEAVAAPSLFSGSSGSSSTTSGSSSSASDSSGSSSSSRDEEDFLTEGETENGAGFGKYSAQLKKLKPGTTYYVRAYAVTADGSVFYGNQLTFRTADSCFIATASFGTFFHPGVTILRDFRDTFLLASDGGQRLVEYYYGLSPAVADRIAHNGLLRFVVRTALLPVVGFSWLALQWGMLAALGVAGVLACCVIGWLRRSCGFFV